MLLAIDTATHMASLALYDESRVLGEASWLTHENHTRSLMPELTRLLELTGVHVEQVGALGVATGPGSFTGLRIGLSVAKGVAFSLNAALVGVPTLEICASMFLYQELPVCAVIQAGRGRYAAACYRIQDHSVRRTGEYVFGTAPAIAEQLQGVMGERARLLVAGEVDQNLKAVLREKSRFLEFANEASSVRRAGYLAALAWQRWRAGDIDDLQLLAPYYIPTASLA
jgi:tRNA threonylcarbamoyladenosine biosynthesis protein TsaB